MQDIKRYFVAPIAMSWNTSVDHARREGYNFIKWRGTFYEWNSQHGGWIISKLIEKDLE